MTQNFNRSVEEDTGWVALERGRDTGELTPGDVELARRIGLGEEYLTHQRRHWLRMISQAIVVLIPLGMVLLLIAILKESDDSLPAFVLLAVGLVGAHYWIGLVGREGWRVTRTDR